MVVTSQVKKSSFTPNKSASVGSSAGSAKGGFVPRGGSNANGAEQAERKTSHYAYTLETDAEGKLVKDENDKVMKSFISTDVLQVYENEFNIALNVLGPLPTGKIYLAKHKART